MKLRYVSFILSLVFFSTSSFSNNNVSNRNVSNNSVLNKSSTHSATLSELKKELLTQEKESQLQKKQRADLIQEIAQYDKKIAQILTELERYQKQLVTLDNEILKLDQEIEQLTQDKLVQKELLAQQLISIFKIGQSGALDLIFNPKKTFENERMSQYYRYLTLAREKSIAQLEQTNTLLNNKLKDLQDKKQKQQTLIAKQNTEKKALEASQVARAQKRVELDNDIQVTQQKITQLKKQADALSKQIQLAEQRNKEAREKEQQKAQELQKKRVETLTKEEAQLISRVNGLGSPKQLFPFPVKGVIQHRFGQPINEQLSWSGLVIQAKEGTPVKAIDEGKVILANWLDGYGFIVVVDHGKGDMSLYGYNQRLAVNIGDTVAKGSTVAYVGKTGSEKNPALYFEIRRNGKAQNPLPWLKAS